MDWVREALQALPEPDGDAAETTNARQAKLTKPVGSLGRLEELVSWLAAWQGKHPPTLAKPCVAIFAGNHGVAATGVSAYPPEVTAQMVTNFENGGAAINALARNVGAKLAVHPVQIEHPTSDFTSAPAMTFNEFDAAISTGRDSIPEDTDMLLLGEMGIGNTTSAAALSQALFGGKAVHWVGPGTGVDESGMKRKRAAVETSVRFHGRHLADPLEALRRVGGRELAAIAGACLEARQRRIPVLLDGFVSTAAAAVLYALDCKALQHCQVSHVSTEPGHRRLLGKLKMTPILDLNMRLGEASGAAVALSIFRAALAAHNDMATFAEAGVSEKSSE